jgi:anti-sigma factor RsiW
MVACLDRQTLAAYADGKLNTEATAAVEAHLEKCRRCAETSARAPENDELIQRIRDLEESRIELDATLSGLKEVQERVTSTLFAGPA